MISNSWYIIVNPISGNRFYKRKKEQLTEAFSKLNSDYVIQETAFSGHEEELVEKAIQQGYRKFISVGGDGTLHHIINGIMRTNSEFSSAIKVGVIPIGTGNDWVKHYSIPKDIEACISILNQEKTVFQDIGKITTPNKVYYFNNLVGIGFDGHVVKKMETFQKFRKLSYFLASLSGLLTYQKHSICYTSEVKSHSANIYLLGIGLCRYCGSGMQLTHNPNPHDGLFDVTVVKDISPLGFIWNIRKMFNQKLHLHPKVDTFKCSDIAIESQDSKSPLMEADGELIPFDSPVISMLPKAIQVVVSEKYLI